VNKNLKKSEISLPFMNTTEIVGVNIEFSDRVYNVFSYYNSPSSTLNYELLSNICMNYENFLIMGDLNSKSKQFSCKTPNKSGDILNGLLTKHSDCLVLNLTCEPTFHIYKLNGEVDHHEFLDLFIGPRSIATNIRNYSVLKSDLLDGCQSQQFHSAVELEIEINPTLETEFITNEEQIFEYSRADWRQFQANLMEFKINNADSITIDSLAKVISAKIVKEKNINIPLHNPKYKPPLPKNLLALIAKRNRLQQKFKKTRKQIDHKNYTNLARKVKEKIGEYKSQ
jgi:hypothetical protein